MNGQISGPGAAEQSGMSLIELLIASALSTIIALAAGSVLFENFRWQQKSLAKGNLTQALAYMGAQFHKKTSNVLCDTALTLASPVASNSQVDVELNLDPDVYKAGAQISGPATFQVDRIYLDDIEEIATNGTGHAYVANLVLKASLSDGGGLWHPVMDRKVSTVTLTTNSAGAFTGCTLVSSVTSPQQSCAMISGMIWDSSSGRCLQETDRNSTGEFVGCPGGTQLNSNNVCVPSASGCRENYLSQGFGKGVVSNCTAPPAGYTVKVVAVLSTTAGGSSGTSPGSGGSAPAPTPTPLPNSRPPVDVPTSCACGGSTIPVNSTSQYCISCKKDDPWGIFGGAVYIYDVYKCDQGNLAWVNNYQTSVDPAVCKVRQRVGTCDGNAGNCSQGGSP